MWLPVAGVALGKAKALQPSKEHCKAHVALSLTEHTRADAMCACMATFQQGSDKRSTNLPRQALRTTTQTLSHHKQRYLMRMYKSLLKWNCGTYVDDCFLAGSGRYDTNAHKPSREHWTEPEAFAEDFRSTRWERCLRQGAARRGCGGGAGVTGPLRKRDYRQHPTHCRCWRPRPHPTRTPSWPQITGLTLSFRWYIIPSPARICHSYRGIYLQERLIKAYARCSENLLPLLRWPGFQKNSQTWEPATKILCFKCLSVQVQISHSLQ